MYDYFYQQDIDIDSRIVRNIYWAATVHSKQFYDLRIKNKCFYHPYYDSIAIEVVCRKRSRTHFNKQALGFIKTMAGMMLMHINDSNSTAIGHNLFIQGKNEVIASQEIK